VLRNTARLTTVRVGMTLQVSTPTQKDRVQIVTPSTTLFPQPIANVGDLISITGISTGPVTLTIKSSTYEISSSDGFWSYQWNTTWTVPGHLYQITASCGAANDTIQVLMQDDIPPWVAIMSPLPGEIVNMTALSIYGYSGDNGNVDYVEVSVDNSSWVTMYGTSPWIGFWDLGELPLGDHLLTARAVDTQGAAVMQTNLFVINESGHAWGPKIDALYVIPTDPTNTSNVIIYANVSTTGPFALNHIILHYNDYYHGMTVTTEMSRYGDFPVQGRHEEDPLRNLSNAPIYGWELGQFPSGSTVSFWIVAVDTANNTRQSEMFSFTVP
jgi:hypothetical protein